MLLISSTEPNTANAVDDVIVSNLIDTKPFKGTVLLVIIYQVRHYDIINSIGCIWFC